MADPFLPDAMSGWSAACGSLGGLERCVRAIGARPGAFLACLLLPSPIRVALGGNLIRPASPRRVIPSRSMGWTTSRSQVCAGTSRTSATWRRPWTA